MNSDISETIKARKMRYKIKIPYPRTQRKFYTQIYHSHFNDHESPSTVAPTNVLVL